MRGIRRGTVGAGISSNEADLETDSASDDGGCNVCVGLVDSREDGCEVDGSVGGNGSACVCGAK